MGKDYEDRLRTVKEKVKQLSEPQLKIMLAFAEFLEEISLQPGRGRE